MGVLEAGRRAPAAEREVDQPPEPLAKVGAGPVGRLDGVLHQQVHRPHELSHEQPPRRVPVVDVEAGIAVAFVRFANNLPDFHMFKMRNGKVELINAVVGPQAASTGWHEALPAE